MVEPIYEVYMKIYEPINQFNLHVCSIEPKKSLDEPINHGIVSIVHSYPFQPPYMFHIFHPNLPMKSTENILFSERRFLANVLHAGVLLLTSTGLGDGGPHLVASGELSFFMGKCSDL